DVPPMGAVVTAPVWRTRRALPAPAPQASPTAKSIARPRACSTPVCGLAEGSFRYTTTAAERTTAAPMAAALCMPATYAPRAMASGTADMMDPVIDGMTVAMPLDITIIPGSRTRYDVPAPTKLNHSMPTATPPSPAATTLLAPKRAASFGDCGAVRIITTAN